MATPKPEGESNVWTTTLQRTNQPIVYVRGEPTDITPAILEQWATAEGIRP